MNVFEVSFCVLLFFAPLIYIAECHGYFNAYTVSAHKNYFENKYCA